MISSSRNETDDLWVKKKRDFTDYFTILVVTRRHIFWETIYFIIEVGTIRHNSVSRTHTHRNPQELCESPKTLTNLVNGGESEATGHEITIMIFTFSQSSNISHTFMDCI